MSETLTRAELAELIYSEVGISKTEASEICLLYTSDAADE